MKTRIKDGLINDLDVNSRRGEWCYENNEKLRDARTEESSDKGTVNSGASQAEAMCCYCEDSGVTTRQIGAAQGEREREEMKEEISNREKT